MKRARSSLLWFSTPVLLAIACGSESGSIFSEGDPWANEPSGSATGTFVPPPPSDDGGDGGDGGGFEACAVDRQQAKLAPLDLVLMQDISGSMWGYTSGTTTKWTAIKDALASFMSDPNSAGIGLGVQFFPLFEKNVPNACSAHADCGDGGRCLLKACQKASEAGSPELRARLCSTDDDCEGDDNHCVDFQRCDADQDWICLRDAQCKNVDSTATCSRPLVKGRCSNQSISCEVQDYSGLTVPIAPLPGVAAAVNAALAERIPNGETPTHAALQGAIEAAKARAAARPESVVAVVLSTDGVPFTNGKCVDDPATIAKVAADAKDGTPSIRTFVIGVLSPNDVTDGAADTLDAIAAAGGTTSATIVDTSADTQAEFIAALQKVRGESLPCEFVLPVPEAGTPDYDKVNVLYTEPATNEQTVIGYVGAKDACDPTIGGWYYDVDPKESTPSKVVLCPTTCMMVQNSLNGVVDVLQGCQTKTQPPPRPK